MLGKLKHEAVTRLVDNWNMITIVLIVAFIFGICLVFAYNASTDAISEEKDEEEVAFIRKKQRIGYLIMLGSNLILAVLAQVILV